MLKSRAIIFFLRLLSWLPLSWARRLGTSIAHLLWLGKGTTVKVTLRNLEICMPELDEQARVALARDSIIETAKTAAEVGAVWLWPAGKVLARIQTRGLDLLREAHAQGKGVIVIGPHLGNWEVLGLYLNTCGIGQSVQLFQAPRRQALDQLIYNARSRAGAKMVATDGRGVTQLLKSLREGLVCGILPDQVPPESGGEFAPFFGRPALTMTLLSKLVSKTGCAAILGYARRTEAQGQAGWEVVFKPADPRLFAQDLQTSLAGLNATIEDAVRDEPALYQWEYKRFKRQPEGIGRPY
jgi:Kdo2-lipid IVA lauroyltransferase/acyltransferase